MCNSRPLYVIYIVGWRDSASFLYSHMASCTIACGSALLAYSHCVEWHFVLAHGSPMMVTCGKDAFMLYSIV